MQKHFNVKKVNVDPMTIVIHPFLELFGFVPSEFYITEWLYFYSINLIIVDTKGRLIKGLPDVLAARKAEIQNLKAIQIDMSEIELVRFISFDHQPAKKEYDVKYKIICFLDQFLNSAEGKDLYDHIEGDMNKKLLNF